MHTNFIQLPPDSTGKKLLVGRSIVITIDDSSQLYRDMEVTTSLSLNRIRISAVVVQGAMHMIHATFVGIPQETLDDIDIGEKLLLGTVEVATVIAPTPTYTFFNATSTVSSDNPHYGQHIDYRGAASVRFSEGSPLSDAFGNLKVSERSTVGNYDFVSDPNDDLFSDVTVGGGAVTFLSDSSTISLSVGAASGDYASRTTNKYHYYLPGTANLTMMTVALGNVGAPGTERNWGVFDDNDGVHFSLNDNSMLCVTMRSSASGSVVETTIMQADWNGDKLDGTGGSGFVLDVTKVNIYWFDYQWLGAGRVRAGVVDEYGNRIVCHTVLNANHHILPYMKSGSLPIRVSIENTTATGASANIRLTCASVQSEGHLNYTYWRYSHEFPPKTISAPNTYCASIKSVNTVVGDYNRVNAYPEKLSLLVTGGAIKLDIYWDYMTLATPTWALTNDSTVVGDSAGTLTLAGDEFKPVTMYLDTGVHNIDLKESFEKWDIGLTRDADGGEPQYIAIVASTLSGSPVVRGVITYAELR